jgi:hypothetical protein
LLFTTQAQLVTAEHDTAIAEFNVAAAIGRPTAPELRLPMRLYDMDRHYQRGKGTSGSVLPAASESDPVIGQAEGRPRGHGKRSTQVRT